MDKYAFGYPRECTKCEGLPGGRQKLFVKPFFQQGGNSRLMLIGQDPTIRRKPERVREALMLNEPKGQLSRWLTDLFGDDLFGSLTLYATNAVKCSFAEVPSNNDQNAVRFLCPFFVGCREHLSNELARFEPDVVLTFGEPAHKFLVRVLDNKDDIREPMKKAFTGYLMRARFKGREFDYSPCLHIRTFRVAETYGEQVGSFKRTVRARLMQSRHR